MDKYVINGGNKLSGKIRIESAKNSVLPIIAGSILTNEQVVVKNCPKIKDVDSMLEILTYLGGKWHFEQNNLVLDNASINRYDIPKNLALPLRSSIFLLGALICRFKKAKIYQPGGCNIGKRPIDLHILALERLGVCTEYFGEQIICSTKDIKSNNIYLKYPSVGATENIILCSVLNKGKTQIFNAAKEPEIVDLMNFLNSMGAKIYGAGTSTILIDGVPKLSGTEYTPMFDRVECGTFILASAITGGEIELSNCNPKNISLLINKLCNNTCKITINNDIIYIKNSGVKKAFSFSTNPYPQFPTDLQAQTMALLSVSEGVSSITENVFENRFNHVNELVKMGADISIKGKTATVKGVKRLKGANVVATDLRGGASLVLAGLNAEGKTTVENICYIERGYCAFDKKLRSLGADIIKQG